MTHDEIFWRSALELAAAIRAKQVSPVEIAEATLATAEGAPDPLGEGGLFRELSVATGPDRSIATDSSVVQTERPLQRTVRSDRVVTTGDPDRFPSTVAEGVPLRRVGDPEADIGAVVVFFTGPGGSYVTGRTLHVDGGVGMFR